ncbi:MAG: plastocyanin/azurin family copper-binding protein, partial [Solirubrobacterales bacterium]
GTVEIVADPSGNLDYETGDLDTEAGVVEIMFTNGSSLGHDVIIENDAGEALGGTEVISGQSTVTDIELDPGTYTYFCSVANHRSEGMQQTLTVKK